MNDRPIVEEPQIVYLSRRNLLTLLSKLDRAKNGEDTERTLVKNDYIHPKYPQSMKRLYVEAIEDEEYYTDREAGEVHPKDDPKQCEKQS